MVKYTSNICIIQTNSACLNTTIANSILRKTLFTGICMCDCIYDLRYNNKGFF